MRGECGLGDEYVFYLSMGVVALNIGVWTYGVWLISGDKNEMSLKNMLFNPNIIAIGVGLVFFLLPLPVPSFGRDVFQTLGDINTGLVMVVLGSYLAQSDLKAMISNKEIYLVCLVRLILIPAIGICLLALFPFVPIEVRLTMLVVIGTPAAALTALLSEKYGKDYLFGIGVVTASTLLSLVIMPLQFMVATAFFG